MVLAQGCGDRETRLTPGSQPVPHEEVLRDRAAFQIPEPEKVWGVGIVGNLPGTGSGVCPAQVRPQLRRMISSSYTDGIDLDAFILSPNTAVVIVEGQIQGSGIRSDVFDLRVTAYDNSGRCSLAGGWLYRTDLILSQNVGNTMLAAVATAEGVVFIPPEQKQVRPSHTGFVLGGGRVVAETATHVILNEPGFREASLVRNLINGRFGFDTARAVSPAQIDVRVPAHYHQERWRFWAVVEALPLADDETILNRRLDLLLRRLVAREDLDSVELALEAMGQSCVPRLAPHLQGAPDVALAAARCLSNLGYPPGISALAQIAGSPQSPYRVQAMHALKSLTKIPQVAQYVASLLGDQDFRFAMDAYETLCMKDGVGVERETVAGVFTLDLVGQNPTQAILATRSGGAYLALFGPPIQLKAGHVVEIPQKKLILDTRSDPQFVVISRAIAGGGKVSEPVKCSHQLRDVIRVLCEKPGLGGAPGGLGLSYDVLLTVLARLSEQGLTEAKLWAGPLPELP